MVIATSELPPIQVTIKDLAGNPITGAHVRATYTHSGLGSSGTSAQDGIATVPLLYCDNEPMCVEAVATGYQADDVGEFQPNREQFSLEMKLEELKSEWEQVTIVLNSSNDGGRADLPIGGRIQIDRTNFHIQISGDVSVNGTVRGWHPFKVVLARLPGMSVTGRPLGRERPVSPLVEGLFTTPVRLGRTDFQRDGEPWFPFQESHGQLSAIQCGDTVLIIDLVHREEPGELDTLHVPNTRRARNPRPFDWIVSDYSLIDAMDKGRIR